MSLNIFSCIHMMYISFQALNEMMPPSLIRSSASPQMARVHYLK
jgi:hypothetical protein